MAKTKLSSVSQEFTTLRKLVEHIMEKYPHTRNSDTVLFCQCYRELGIHTLDEIESSGISIHHVDRLRRVIQNKEGKFLPDEEVQRARGRREQEVRAYMAVQ